MSSKNLLSENTIRRFMTLANMGTVGTRFLSERAEDVDPEEEEVVADPAAAIPDAEAEAMPPAEADPEMEDDLDVPMGGEDIGGDADISLTEEEAQILIDLGERLSSALGDAIEGEPDIEDLGAVDDAPVDDAPVDAAPADAMAGAPPPEEEEEEEDPVVAESVINEVLRRVTKRIIKEKLS